MWEWAYSGVNLDLEGTGGQECIDFIPPSQRFYETIGFCILAIIQLAYAIPKITFPAEAKYVERAATTRRALLLLHATTFGVEIGFKCSTHSLIWIFNPCHVVTMFQLFLLTAPPSPFVTTLFRFQMHFLNGPFLALAFPVLNTRLLPFEQFIYYAQHILILVIPYFLLKAEGPFTVEPIFDFSWILTSHALQTLYHFTVLQYIGLQTLVNVDHMLCPAISDPFRGLHYRKAAVIHQTAMIAIFGKLLVYLNRYLADRVAPYYSPLPAFYTLYGTTKEEEKKEVLLLSNCRRLFKDQTLWFTSSNSAAAVQELMRLNGVAEKSK